MRRREFIAGLGAAAWVSPARAQQSAVPVVGFVYAGSADTAAGYLTPFRKGLGETGYVEGQSVTVEYHWLDGQYDRLPALMADLVRRRVAVIATPINAPGAIAAKAATATIPIVFAVGADPVELGLVASLALPGGNATGINFFALEVNAKRLGLLYQLVPKAVRVAVLLNPSNATSAEVTLRSVQEAAGVNGLQIQVINASTSREIDAAFATLARERPDALFVSGDAFFNSRRVQFATLATRDKIPAAYPEREYVEVGGLMSYGTSFADTFRQVGIYTGSILQGAKPADLPVVQSTKFEFVVNLQTARALGIEVPHTLLALADEVIQQRLGHIGAPVSSKRLWPRELHFRSCRGAQAASAAGQSRRMRPACFSSECPLLPGSDGSDQSAARRLGHKATSDSPIRGWVSDVWGALDGRLPPGLQLPTSHSLD